MTKPLNTQLSQQDGPAPRSGSRPRTWLVALLGFGAADLLVLNLWAVPNLITNGDTTTDMRAAQSGEGQAPRAPAGDSQPTAAAVLPAEPEQPAQAREAEPPAKPDEPEREPAKAEVVPAADATPAEAATKAAAKPESLAQLGAQGETKANEAAQAAQEGARANIKSRARARLYDPPPEPEHAEAPPQPAAASPRAADPSEAPTTPTGLSAEAYAPPDPGSAAPFAIRAAQRALRFALQDHAAGGGTGPFAGLSDDDKPFTQIYFSLGNFMLGPNGKQVLERMLPQLLSDERSILIVGSADPSGSEQVNEKLSDARAQAVAEWLLIHGVDAGRIQTRAIGHEGAVGNTLDRRVDIWLGGSR